MLERFDHRPMLTAVLALTTTVLLVVVVAMLIMLPQATSPARDSGGGNPAGAAAPANMDAGGENYGWDIHNRAVCSVELAKTGHGCQEGRSSQQ
jgi:hypothetical protein